MACWHEACGAEPTTQEAIQRWQRECERAGADCGARVEAVALRQPWARALRRGPRLTIFTRQGEVTLVDNAGEEADYRYLGLLAPGCAHLVAHRSPSRRGFLTVSDADGHQKLYDQLASALEPHSGARKRLASIR